MTTFKVGEVAIHICDVGRTPDADLRAYDGMDCIVIESFGQHPTWDGETPDFMFGYVIRFSDGTKLVAEPHELRKRRPPATDESESRQAMLDCIERARRPAMEPA